MNGSLPGTSDRRERRRLLAAGISLASLVAAGPVLAAALVATPRQTAGPFYPKTLPLDSDNDLVRVAGRPRPAAGQVTHLFGRVLDDRGRPLDQARVEIWQCDAFGYYHHPRDRGGRADPDFQGYGRTVTGADGAYRFRTIAPVPYPGRTPHIHFAVSGPGIERLTTQMYLRGHPLNAGDLILNRIRDPQARESVLVELSAARAEGLGLEPDALAGRFDLVLDRSLLHG